MQNQAIAQTVATCSSQGFYRIQRPQNPNFCPALSGYPQFTSKRFTKRLTDVDVKISMDGKGRALDNIFVERLWRIVKYENIYLKDYRNGKELYHGLDEYFSFYNTQRPHQSLGYRVPEDIHYC
ncbi:MAG: transposase [Candidatus Electrothrix sp. AR3]|nr:transposase [Candidatus Electrothrix sp. AR3]